MDISWEGVPLEQNDLDVLRQCLGIPAPKDESPIEIEEAK